MGSTGTPAIAPLDRSVAVDAWNKAFSETDSSAGGCPDVGMEQ